MIFQREFEKLRNQNILELNLKIFRYYGLLLDDSVHKTRWEKVKGMAKQLFTVSLVIQYLLGTSVELYLSMGNIQKAGDCFIFLISHLKNAVKFGTFIIYRKKILYLLSKIEDNYYIKGITPTNAERSLVQSYMGLSKRIAKYVWISYFITQASLIINTPPRPNLELITDPQEIKNIRRDSSIKMWFPFGAIESPYFEVTTVYESITMSIYFAFTTTVNITLVGLIIHTTAQFAVLADAIRNGVTRAAGVRPKQRRETGKSVPSLIIKLVT
jgi:heme exporter protein D